MNKEEKEKYYTKKYMKLVYDYEPKFIPSKKGMDIPDCYFEYNNEFIAVEVTGYHRQNSDIEYQETCNNMQKYVNKSNFLERIYNSMGKKESDCIYIGFKYLNELYKILLDNEKYIEELCINGNYYLENKQFIIKNNANKKEGTLKEFLDIINDDILNNNSILIKIKRKNKYNILLRFIYDKHQIYGNYDNDNTKRIIKFYVYRQKYEETYKNILESIENKNIKLEEYKELFKINKLEYNEYNLVVHSHMLLAEVDCKILYKMILDNNLLQYDEVAIFLENGLMVINSKGYSIYT